MRNLCKIAVEVHRIEVLMHGEYVVVCRWGLENEQITHIPSGTPKEAKRNAENIIRLLQDRLTREYEAKGFPQPFTLRVTGDIYRRIATIENVKPLKSK